MWLECVWVHHVCVYRIGDKAAISQLEKIAGHVSGGRDFALIANLRAQATKPGNEVERGVPAQEIGMAALSGEEEKRRKNARDTG